MLCLEKIAPLGLLATHGLRAGCAYAMNFDGLAMHNEIRLFDFLRQGLHNIGGRPLFHLLTVIADQQ